VQAAKLISLVELYSFSMFKA